MEVRYYTDHVEKPLIRAPIYEPHNIIIVFTDSSEIPRKVSVAAVTIKNERVLLQSKYTLNYKTSNNQAVEQS